VRSLLDIAPRYYEKGFDASVPWDDFGAVCALVEAGFRLRRPIV